MRSIKELMGLEEAEKMKGEDPCWDNYEMIGTKPGKGGRPVPNCVLKKPKKAKPKNEEVELDEAKVGDTVSFHHELKSAPGSKVKKSGTVEKVDGDVVHVKVKDKYGVKRHQIKMGDLVKEETELEEASDTKRPPNFTMYPIDRQDYKILRPPKKTPPKSGKEWGRDGGEKKIKEETEQIDELNKDTVYSYNKKADADIEKKHKSLGQLMRRGDAAGANKTAHQLNKRVAGMERAEKRLNSEEVEMDEGMLDAVKGAAKSVAKRVADSAKSTAVGFVHGAIDSATSHSPILRHAGKKLHKVVKKKLGEETEQIDEISAEVKQKYLAAATKKHLQQFLGRAPVRDKQELDKRRAAIQKTSKELTGKTHYQEEVEVEESKKIPASEKPVDPKDLVVSLKDVPVKNPRGSGKYKPEQDFPGVKALKREEIELEEIEVEMTHQERAYKRSLDLKTTVLEAVKSMKKKEVTKDVDVKKGEKLSGKQETVKMNPALYEK